MKQPADRLVCPKCGEAVDTEDLACPSCEATLETVLVKRSTRGRRYVYGKRKVGLSPEVIWLLVVILIGLLIIVATQLFAFMRSRKLVEHTAPPVSIARVVPGSVGAVSRPRPRALETPTTNSLTASAPHRLQAEIAIRKGTLHEIRLRHLCHAHRTAGGGDPRPGGHRV
jgi:hypothetical protein